MSEQSVPNIDPGVRGFTRSTWRDESSLRGLLVRLLNEHPNATRDFIKALYGAKVEMVQALIEEAWMRTFDNDWTSIHKSSAQPSAQPNAGGSGPVVEPTPVRAARPRPTPQEVAAKAVEIATAVERVRTIVLLDLEEPNGKKLGDCTAGEARAFGGWRIALADRVGDDSAVIRTKVSEAEAAGIYAGAK